MREFLRMMKRYARPYAPHFAGSILLNIFSGIFNVFSFSIIIPMLKILFNIDAKTYEFIDWSTQGMSFKDILINNAYWGVFNYIETHGTMGALFMLAGIFAGLTLIKTSCYFGASAVMIPIRTGIVKDIRTELYRKVLSLPIGFFSEERKGDILARISGDVAEVENSITSSIEMFIKDPILILIYFATFIYISPELTLFVMIFVPGFVWIMSVIGKQLKRQSLEAQAYWSDTMSQIEETLSGLRIIKAFNAEKKMDARFDSVSDKLRRKNNRVATRQALAHPVSELLGTLMILIVLCFGGVIILRGSGFFGKDFIDAQTFIFFMIILYSVIAPIKELSRAFYGIPKGLASMERINKILHAENPIKEKENPVRLSSFEKGISLKGVSFSYNESKIVLQDISFDIAKGKRIAIVGESGAGKSTLVDLIPRFYDPTSGSIEIDGIDTRDIAIADVRSLMGNVNQDAILFNDTIFNNIAFGVENATMEQVVAAAKIANAHEFIMEKEGGYDSSVGDRGVKLSGGQRQRISIARAILKNPPILILDEATAALDTESERAVQEALERLMSSRTTIAIAHRLSTIRDSDEIIVMKDGRIVERGTHASLTALGGYYKRLNDMQQL
ncbi:MAG: ABC transporter ATP-binding protein [Bacteroidales bacterium]|nr:ABC transporter ATP-binding protein [Bacteroidales bacterium]